MPYNAQGQEDSEATNLTSAYARLLALMGGERRTPSTPGVEGVPDLPPGPFPLPHVLHKTIVDLAATLAARAVGERKIDVKRLCDDLTTAAARQIVEKALDPASVQLSPEARSLLVEARDNNLDGLALLGLWFALRKTEGLKGEPRLDALVALYSADEERRFAATIRLARKANTGKPGDQAKETLAFEAYRKALNAGSKIEGCVDDAVAASGHRRRWIYHLKAKWEREGKIVPPSV